MFVACSVVAMVSDWIRRRTMVRYRVYWVILRRPSSPSFCRRSRYGKTTCINCKMIEAVIYGMMPSAKMVICRKLPPLNKSKMPSTEPCDCLNISSSTPALMPGVGMCAPMRYTPSRASVNSTRFRKSGMRNMFLRASTNRFILLPAIPRYPTTPYKLRYDLKTAACFGDLVFGRSAEGMRVNRQLGLQLAVAQNLDRIGYAAHKTMRAEQVRCYRLALRKNV